MNTTLNSTVRFTCEADSGDISFFVDGTLATYPDVVNRGFTQDTNVKPLGNGMWSRGLLSKASENNNNTNISCRVIGSQIVYSDIAVLRIQGKLVD